MIIRAAHLRQLTSLLLKKLALLDHLLVQLLHRSFQLYRIATSVTHGARTATLAELKPVDFNFLELRHVLVLEDTELLHAHIESLHGAGGLFRSIVGGLQCTCRCGLVQFGYHILRLLHLLLQFNVFFSQIFNNAYLLFGLED